MTRPDYILPVEWDELIAELTAIRQEYLSELDAMDPDEACFFTGHAEVVRARDEQEGTA